jgi:hypothetical protein
VLLVLGCALGCQPSSKKDFLRLTEPAIRRLVPDGSSKAEIAAHFGEPHSERLLEGQRDVNVLQYHVYPDGEVSRELEQPKEVGIYLRNNRTFHLRFLYGE